MLEKERYELLKDSNIIRSTLANIDKLVNDDAIINTINSMQIKKLDYLLNVWYCMWGSDGDELSNLKQLLQNQRTANVFNSFEIDKLKVLYFDRKMVKSRFMWLVDNVNVQDALNLIDIERYKILMQYDISHTDFIVKDILLKNGNTARLINSIDVEKLKLIHEISKFDVSCLAKMFENLEIVDAVKSIEIEKLYYLLKNGEMCAQFLGKRNFSQSNAIELLINDDKYYHLNNVDDLTNIDRINIERLRIIIESDLFDCESILKLINTSDTIDMINSMNIDNLLLLLKHNTNWPPLIHLIRKPGRWIELPESAMNWNDRGYIDPINSFKFGKFKQIVFDVLSKPELFANVNAMESKRLELLLKTIIKNSEVSCYMFGHALSKPKFIDSFSISKLEILLEKYAIYKLTCIANRKKTLEFVESINTEKLRTLLTMINSDYDTFIEISNCYKEEDFKFYLDFVIALYRAGVIEGGLELDFFKNKSAIENEIKTLFPENFPIDQILRPSSIKNRGIVSNLKNICLEATIGLLSSQFDGMEFLVTY